MTPKPLKRQSGGWSGEGTEIVTGSLPPGLLPWQPRSRAWRRLCGGHLFSWLHCLATGSPCLFSALEEDAFLHGPSGRTRSRALARAVPHDGFSDYDFLMWRLLSHVADPGPSGVSLSTELLEGKICIVLMPARVYACTHRYKRRHTCVKLMHRCGCKHWDFISIVVLFPSQRSFSK